ncbi:MAG: HAD hydrolase family protein [Candidatus Aminicenantes bacterium]|nr:HAD hydrolase family protein [Candidatus Aminicenantes bacterium]
MNAEEKAKKIKMILMDVDGTLTNGTLHVLQNGEEVKSYHVRDGLGIILAHLVGFETGIITGKSSKALEQRAKRLRMSELHQGVLHKKKIFLEIRDRHKLKSEEIAYIGDDLGDLDVIKSAGFSGAVADAHLLIQQNADYVCNQKGGFGAVREFIEFIFNAQNKWDEIKEKVKNLK